MPWSPKQHRLFEAAAHDADIASERGLTTEEAGKLAKEGIKKAAQAPDQAPAPPSNFTDLTSVFDPDQQKSDASR